VVIAAANSEFGQLQATTTLACWFIELVLLCHGAETEHGHYFAIYGRYSMYIVDHGDFIFQNIFHMVPNIGWCVFARELLAQNNLRVMYRIYNTLIILPILEFRICYQDLLYIL